MSEPESQDDPLQNMSREEMMSALFAHLVIQNTNMALMFVGKVPNPQTNERVYDIEAARMFIDQLEMLDVKTKGNLSREEEKLLQQSLTHLRLTFVDAVNNPPREENATPSATGPTGAPAPETAAPAPADTIQPAGDTMGDADARKKFTKKY
jgi:hypothetical protein